MSDEQPAADTGGGTGGGTGGDTAAPAAAPKTFGGDVSGLKEAASAIREKREADPAPSHTAEEPSADGQRSEAVGEADVKLHWADGKDRSDGITVKDAAHELRGYHIREAQARAELAAQLAGEQADQQPHPEQPADWTRQPYDNPDNLPPGERAPTDAELIERQLIEQQGRQAAEQARTNRDRSADVIAQNLANAHALVGQSFPELAAVQGNPQAVAAAIAQMQQQNPARYAAFLQLDQQYRQAHQVLQQVRAQQHQEMQEQADFERQWKTRSMAEYIAGEEKAAEELVYASDPELKNNPEKAAQFTFQMGQYLRSVGVTPDQWRKMRNDGRVDRRTYAVVADAVRWRQAQAKAKEVAKKPLPPVQRPGVSNGRHAAAISNEAGLRQRLRAASGTSKSAHIAAELMRVQRAARGR